MLYVKSMTDDYTTIQIEITDENTYSRCCDCGQETSVNLGDIGGIHDLFSAKWRCEACSYRHALQHRGQPWAEQIISEHRYQEGV